MTLDFGADQSVLDNLEAVTFTSVRRPGNVRVAVPDASRVSLQVREVMPSGGVYTGSDVVWTVRRAALASCGYKPADTVTDAAGVVYTVLSLVDATVGGFVRLSTRNLALAFDLRDTCSIRRPGNATDAAGKRVPDLSDVATNVPVRVQKQTGRRDDAFDAPATATRATAWLGVQVFTELGDVLETSGLEAPAERYTVVGWTNPDRIDQLMSLDLEARE